MTGWSWSNSSSVMGAASFPCSGVSIGSYVMGLHGIFCIAAAISGGATPPIRAFRTKTKAWAVRPRFYQRHFTPTERQI